MKMWENLLILKNKDQVMNFEIPPSDLLIKKLILKPPEGIRATPTNENGSWELADNEGTTPLKHVPLIKKVSDVLQIRLKLHTAIGTKTSIFHTSGQGTIWKWMP